MKQRSKEELLRNLRTYEGIKKDEHKGSNIRGSVALWRMSVAWFKVLYYDYHFSIAEINRILSAVVEKDVFHFDKKEKDRIQKLIESKGCDWGIFNVTSQRKKNVIDKTLESLENYNTEISVNYNYMVFEYLITVKGFGFKRLNHAAAEIQYLDLASTDKIWDIRETIYNDTGIWLSLDNETAEDCFGRDFNEYSNKCFSEELDA